MATIKTKFTVGLFVVAGLSLAVVSIIWLGMTHYFEEGRMYVAYFDESVQGLDKDSPVKYRGVSIGRVSSIGVAPDANLIQVVLKIETSIELDKTIVAQLKSVGITGIMFVELEKIEAAEPAFSQSINFPTKYPVINTQPSDRKQFFDAVNEALLEFTTLDIKGVTDSLKTTLAKIDQAIEDAQVQRLSQQIDTALDQIQQITETQKWHAVIDGINTSLASINSLAGDGQSAISNLNTTIGHADQAIIQSGETIEALISDLKSSVQAIDSLVTNGDVSIARTNNEIVRFMMRLNLAVQHYEKAGKNLNRFLERIADQPSQLIFSEPPEIAAIEQGKGKK